MTSEDFHSGLMRLNELINSNIIGDEHIIVQELTAFSTKFGAVFDDPVRNMKDMHKKFPALCSHAEHIRNAISGRQAYNVYLGKHDVGKAAKGLQSTCLPSNAKSFNHVSPSNSSFKKKTIVPILQNGVIVNFINILLELYPKLPSVQIETENSCVTFVSLIFDQKAISPGVQQFGSTLYGVEPNISSLDAKDFCKNGCKEMLKKLISDLKEGHFNWVKQGEVFMLQLLDKNIAVPVAIYYLTKASNHLDV